MKLPPLSLGLSLGVEAEKAVDSEFFSIGQAHGHLYKSGAHSPVHALSGRLQAGPNDSIELTVPASLIKGVFDALHEPGAEFVVRNNRTESAVKVMTKDEVKKIGGIDKITERGHSYNYTLGPIVELSANGDYDKLWAISIDSKDLGEIRNSYGLETSPQLGFYIPVGIKKKKVTEENKVSKLASDKVQHTRTMYHGSPLGNLTKLRQGSYVTPIKEVAYLMGRFHEDTGKTWSDEDLAEPHFFGKDPKWKSGREPKGVPTVYEIITNDDDLDLLDNPYEHKTKVELSLKKILDNSVSKLASDLAIPADLALVHYSKGKLDELRPLSYEELLKSRTRGRWLDAPEKAKEYVEGRRKYENELHKMLNDKGIVTDPSNSFLYATLGGHENFGTPGQYRHESPLTPELINQSLFDVVGAGDSQMGYGEEGLKAALRRWQEAKDAGTLKSTQYMGMNINPRIEVITPSKLKPTAVNLLPTPDLTKNAAMYNVTGDKVQGVGLRKLYHSLLEANKLKGLAVNNEETGDVELSFDGKAKDRAKLFKELSDLIQAKTQRPINIEKSKIQQKLVPVNMTGADVDKVIGLGHLAYRRSPAYDPKDQVLKSTEEGQKELMDRYRLGLENGNLVGKVPQRAYEQLMGVRPMYKAFAPESLVRSEEEALSGMEESNKKRLLDMLGQDRGFLTNGINKLAELLREANS